MVHEHEASELPNGFPDEVQAQVADPDALLAVDGALGSSPRCIGRLEQRKEADLRPIKSGSAPLALGGRGRHRFERHGIFA
jgi:hypothetical protein